MHSHGPKCGCAQLLAKLHAHCVHTAHTEAKIRTQEYLSPIWQPGEAAKPI